MEFRILGPLEVLVDGHAVSLGGDKQRALLALLVIHANRTLSKERLIDELWGGEPPATAAKTLQVHISRLRKTLEQSAGKTGTVATREHGYELRTNPEEVDALRFERLVGEARTEQAAGRSGRACSTLEEALSLWRGPPLEEFAYDRFAQLEIARLEEMRVAALEELVEAKLALGRHHEVVAELEALIAEQPYRERLRAQLMLALYRCDRQAEALEAYQDARRRLVDELGIEPGERLRELERAILKQDPALAFSEEVGHGEERQVTVASSGAFVGRERELSELVRALDDAIGGRGRLALLAGDPGIGKSRLAEELVTRAQARGALVLVGRCWEAGGAPAYWPWVQSLRTYVREREPVALRAEVAAGASDLAQVIPDLRERFPDLPEPAALDPEGARFRLFDAVAEFLRSASKSQPMVLVLDDLHAADAPSLLLLRFLVRELASMHVLIVAAYRDLAPTSTQPLAEMVAAVAREPVTSRLELTGLSEHNVEEYVQLTASETVPPGLVATLHAETEGNPLFLGEMVRLLEAEGEFQRPFDELRAAGRRLPDTITDVIGQRLRRLRESCRRMLEEASVLGRAFGVRELAALVDRPEGEVLEALDEALSARVISEAPSPGRFRFSHMLIRDTLYEGLDPSHRRAAHLRAGEILEELYAADSEPHLAELAHHSFEALPSGDPGKAAHQAERAGDRATALLAYEEAARLYALALDAVALQAGETAERRCALLIALGDARARAGDEPEAQQAFLQAVDIAGRAGLAVLHAHAALGYGGRFVWSRAYGDVHLIELLEGALQALPGDQAGLRAKLMARLSGALRDYPSRERRASLSAQAVAIARDLGHPATLAYALDGRYCAIMWPENPPERLEIANEIVELANQVGDQERAIMGRLYRAIANMELGRMMEVEAELKLTAAQATQLRQPAQLWMSAASLADVALFQGRFDEAEQLIADALRLGERAQSRDSVLSHRLQLFVFHRETGAGEDVEALIADAVARFPARPVFKCALAYIHAASGRASLAQATLEQLAGQDFAAIQRDNEYLFSLALLADVADTLGDIHAAQVLYDLLLPYADLNACNLDEIATGSVSRSLGILAATAARWEDAFRQLETAVRHNNEMGALPWVAHSKHDHARALLARGAPEDRPVAQQLLDEVRGAYEALGMTIWARRAEQLRRARPQAA